MKTSHATRWILAAGLLLISTICSYAQSDPSQYQGYVIWEDVVYPSEAERYEEMTRKQIAFYADRGFPYRVDVYQTTEFIYYWVFEADQYADIDTLYQAFNRMYEEEPDRVKEIDRGFAGTHETTLSWTCYMDRSLSFKPGGLMQSGSENPFIYMGFCYPRKGEMEAAREVMRTYVKLATRTGASLGWDTFVGDMGVETPMFFWASYTADPIEFYSRNGADFDRMGDEADVLWRKLTGVMRKYEEKTGWYRRDLSHIP